MKPRLLLLLGALMLSACSNLPILRAMEERADQHFNPDDVLESAVVTSSNADGSVAKSEVMITIGPMEPKSFAKMLADGDDISDLNAALTKFNNECVQDANAAKCRLKRNNAQDRLIAASNAICRQYKNKLKRSHAESNQKYGVLATVFGGLGAVVTSSTPARLFSGAASVVTGVRAETNQVMYSMLAIEIITKAIDKGRYDMLKQIDGSQRSEISTYSMARAIADAEEYHSKCSLLAGLQEASAAVAHANDTGLKELNETLVAYGRSVDVQLGAKRWEQAIKTPVLLSPVCTQLRSEWKSAIDKGTIKEETNRVAWARLDALLGTDGYCDQTATASDKAWETAYAAFVGAKTDSQKNTAAADLENHHAQAEAQTKYVKQTNSNNMELLKPAK